MALGSFQERIFSLFSFPIHLEWKEKKGENDNFKLEESKSSFFGLFFCPFPTPHIIFKVSPCARDNHFPLAVKLLRSKKNILPFFQNPPCLASRGVVGNNEVVNVPGQTKEGGTHPSFPYRKCLINSPQRFIVTLRRRQKREKKRTPKVSS